MVKLKNIYCVKSGKMISVEIGKEELKELRKEFIEKELKKEYKNVLSWFRCLVSYNN